MKLKIVSIEPTPSPNVMKLNLDESLPDGKNIRLSKKDHAVAPPRLRKLLEIEGVTGLFQVLDFISLERHPKADWQLVLAKAREALEDEGGNSNSNGQTDTSYTEDESFQEIVVQVQQIKGIPLQVKLQRNEEEQRFALSERFTNAVLEVQSAVSNHIFDRKWIEQRPRYGEMADVGEQVAEELSAAYDQKRLQKLIHFALHPDVAEKPQMTWEETKQAMQSSDWKKRYQAMEQMEPRTQSLPLLEQALQDEKMTIRRQAVVVLGWFESEEALPLLYLAMRDKSPIVRRTAGDCLSDLGFADAIPVMCQALSDSNKLVRWRAARYLFEVGDERAIPALKQVIDDPEFEVHMQAQIALERIEKGEEASGTIWQQMTRSSRKQSEE